MILVCRQLSSPSLLVFATLREYNRRISDFANAPSKFLIPLGTSHIPERCPKSPEVSAK